MEQPAADNLHDHEGGDDPEAGQQLAVRGMVGMRQERSGMVMAALFVAAAMSAMTVPFMSGTASVIMRVRMLMMVVVGRRSHGSLFSLGLGLTGGHCH
jgi:hypothetical protein